MSRMNEFTVVLSDENNSISYVRAFEMDVTADGALVFSGINRGGYVAAYAAGMWVHASCEEESAL